MDTIVISIWRSNTTSTQKISYLILIRSLIKPVNIYDYERHSLVRICPTDLVACVSSKGNLISPLQINLHTSSNLPTATPSFSVVHVLFTHTNPMSATTFLTSGIKTVLPTSKVNPHALSPHSQQLLQLPLITLHICLINDPNRMFSQLGCIRIS